MVKIGFVIPCYKEKTIGTTISNIKKIYRDASIVVVADDEKTAKDSISYGAFVPFHQKRLGYGCSLTEGMRIAYFSFNCDLIVTMDCDHPISIVHGIVQKMLSSHEVVDVVVGHETGEWKVGKRIGNQLVRIIVGVSDKLENPTCGLVVWKKRILEKMPWNVIKCKWDAVHYELLFFANRNKAIFDEYSFPDHGGKRRYGIRRWLDWFVTLLRISRLRYFWFWRDFKAVKFK